MFPDNGVNRKTVSDSAQRGRGGAGALWDCQSVSETDRPFLILSLHYDLFLPKYVGTLRIHTYQDVPQQLRPFSWHALVFRRSDILASVLHAIAIYVLALISYSLANTLRDRKIISKNNLTKK